MAARLKHLERFADDLRIDASLQKQAGIKRRSKNLGLELLPEEVVVYAALEEPQAVQEFIGGNLPYNASASETKESCRSPRNTLIEGSAHCFEGAIFALAANFLNRRRTKIVLLEAGEGYDHNLDVYQNPKTKKWGCNEESGLGSFGREPTFRSIRAMARSFAKSDPAYIRYSDPIDVIDRFGIDWITAPDTSDIYYHYVDDSVKFHRIFGRDYATDQKYPLVVALKNKWIAVDDQNQAVIVPENLPVRAQKLWEQYQTVDKRFDSDEKDRLVRHFLAITGITPQALEEQAFDFKFYLQEGYDPEELLIDSEA